MQVGELRKLNAQAEDMIAKAKQLYAEADAAKGAQKARLEREADEWAAKARDLAQTVNRLVKAS